MRTALLVNRAACATLQNALRPCNTSLAQVLRLGAPTADCAVVCSGAVLPHTSLWFGTVELTKIPSLQLAQVTSAHMSLNGHTRPHQH